jgi:hypothetical protein
MILLWIGSAVLLLVIVPVVVRLLRRVLEPVEEIESAVHALRAEAELIVALLDAVDALPETRSLVGQTGSGASRYGAALDKVL